MKKVSVSPSCPFDVAMDLAMEHGRVNIRGIGSIELREYRGRKVRNPITKRFEVRPVSRRLVFTPARKVREKINGD